MFYLAAAVAVFCAAAVFFLLCERDHSLLAQTISSAKVTQVSAAPAVPVTAPANTAAARVSGAEIPFSLTRSRRFHRVGPVSVGVWKIYTRNDSVDLSVLAYGHRINKNRLKVNETVSIDGKNPGQSLKLTVNRVDRNEISGYLVPG